MPDARPHPMAGRTQPARSDVAGNERLLVVQHPLCDHFLATVRDAKQSTGSFGVAAGTLATCLIWEACRTLDTVPGVVAGFDGSEIGVSYVADAPAGISILRAGEVFAGPFRRLFPSAPLYHVGIRRNEETLGHHVYSNTIAERIETQRLLILDPMLATGGSVLVVLDLVRTKYRGPITVVSLVAAPLGVQAVLDGDPDTWVVTGALDECLNEQGYIVPGLGDAGDRFFGTPG